MHPMSRRTIMVLLLLAVSTAGSIAHGGVFFQGSPLVKKPVADRLMGVALAYERDGKPQRAAEVYRSILRQDPQHAAASRRLEELENAPAPVARPQRPAVARTRPASPPKPAASRNPAAPAFAAEPEVAAGRDPRALRAEALQQVAGAEPGTTLVVETASAELSAPIVQAGGMRIENSNGQGIRLESGIEQAEHQTRQPLRATLRTLIDALGDPDPEQRTTAAYALGRLGTAAAPATARLEELAGEQETDPFVQEAAAQALAAIRGDR